MGAQLRAIPSLQAHQDPSSYKQLQDAPRLKSIIKGALEDRPEIKSLDKIRKKDIPRTNPVNLVSVLCPICTKSYRITLSTKQRLLRSDHEGDVSSTSRAESFSVVIVVLS